MDHKNLEVWKKAIDFVAEIYSATEIFPRHERYGLTNQLRRAAVSIPSNIAEGAARQSDKEMIQFLYISLGSLAEVETQVIISKRLEYIANESYLLSEVQRLRKMLTGLIRYLKAKEIF